MGYWDWGLWVTYMGIGSEDKNEKGDKSVRVELRDLRECESEGDGSSRGYRE